MSVRRLAPADQQPPSFAFSEEGVRFAVSEVAKYPEGRQASAVIALLWRAQKQAGGWLPQRAIEAVAVKLDMPLIRVMEVATFYTMFNLEPVGRYFVQLCGTVPCHVKGAIDLKQALLERVGDQHHVTADGNFSWLEVECLGACCNAPMVQINDDYYEDLTPDLLLKLLDDLAAGRPVKPGPQNGRRASEPEGGADTLSDPALYDGSMVGGWRQLYKDRVAVPDSSESETANGTAANDPIPAKPGSTHAYHQGVAETPGTRAANGESATKPEDDAAASAPGRTGTAGLTSGREAPQSGSSYTATPSKPESGRLSADDRGSTPSSGTPASQGEGRSRGNTAVPTGAEPSAKPGTAPDEH